MAEPQQVSGAEEPPLKDVDVEQLRYYPGTPEEIWQQGYKAGWYDHALQAEASRDVTKASPGLPVNEMPVIQPRGQRALPEPRVSRGRALLALLPKISEWRPWRVALYVLLVLGGIWFLNDIVFDQGQLTSGLSAVWTWWIAPDVAIVTPGVPAT